MCAFIYSSLLCFTLSRLSQALVTHFADPTKSTAALTTHDESCGSDGDPLSGGLAYIKEHKVAGSTFAGVIRRIGERRNFQHTRDSYWLDETTATKNPSVWANHGGRVTIESQLQKQMPCAFFVTMIREPVDRCMSQYYYQFYKDGAEVHPGQAIKDKTEFMRALCSESRETQYISPDGTADESRAMDAFDFVAVTERFDESLVLLGKKLNASFVDLLYLAAKESGEAGTRPKDHNRERSVHIEFHEESREVKAAAEMIRRGTDASLLSLANNAFDKATAAYGPNFKADLQRFQDMLAVVEGKCRSRFDESCLWKDNGCGQDCIDEVAHEHGWE